METQLTITRDAETEFSVQSGKNTYHVTKTNGRWHCSCPARGMCKHLRTVLGCFGMGVSATLSLDAHSRRSADDRAPVRPDDSLGRLHTDNSGDDGLLSPEEFDAEAGRDVRAEIDYIRSGREKRNYGC